MIASVNNPKLRKAVREYYTYLGDRKAKPVMMVDNLYSDYVLLLVRFIDSDGNEMSALMDIQEWADGHFDVTEMFTADRADEERLCKDFVESKEYKIEVVE